MTQSSVGQRALLALAGVAVCFAAADTYVVVLALPDMMSGVGVPIDELQRAAPIVSGFLLGYIAMLPLTGRIADLRGRMPVLVGSLVVFAIGSLLTAAAYDLPSMVSGRFLQGVGAGGLVPATLALVADLYPPERRGVPLGVIGAVQELGSVLGPLYGALVLAVADWEEIFWINLAVGLVLAAAVLRLRPRPAPTADWLLIALAVLASVAVAVVMLQPSWLVDSVSLGGPFVPYAGDSRWFSTAGLVALLLVLVAVARLDPRRWADIPRETDILGALLLGLALGGVILAFATADPAIEVFSPAGPWLLLGSVVAAAAFVVRNRRTSQPLVPGGALAAAPAWGSLVVSFFVGSALIAALVDIPVAARITVYPDSQLDAALVLLRFLIALPVGALLGGWLTHRLPSGLVTLAGMVLAALGFAWMSQWTLTSLESWVATIPLLLGGLGFGLALAPVNAALLASTEDAVHGVASALLVVGRMVGMLVGISALTTIGLRRFYEVTEDIPPATEVCDGKSLCPAYNDLLQSGGLEQLEVIFLGAAGCALVAGGLALVTFRSARTRGLATSELLRSAG
ncbi:MAG TPA: MFS transporter [Nocardioidaceae bacterium]|nr:MFS transporter [Nocardioidaceae bacterium]